MQEKVDKLKVNTLISIVCYENEFEVCDFVDQIEMQEDKNKLAIVITINKARDLDKLEAHVKN